jgi:arylsulfatase A-like enzyme
MTSHHPREFVMRVFITLGLFVGSCAMGADAVARPNVLIVMADDLRADAMGAWGDRQAITPHLDRLCREGVNLTACYGLGSNSPAVCQPSRNMFLTGRAYFRWPGRVAPASLPNLPDLFRAGGYETYHHGKRGNTAPDIQARFETNQYVDDEADRTSGEPGKTIVDAAITHLEQRQDERPWLMFLALANPHDPRVAGESYRRQFATEKIALPVNFLPQHPFDNGELLVRDERLAPWPRTQSELQRHWHDYYATILAMDAQFGRLLAALSELGMRENTIVVFTSDNGLAMGSHGLMGKQSLYEHSIRVPLVVTGPGLAFRNCDSLQYLHDVLPTLCEACGLEMPHGLDGISQWKNWRGEESSTRKLVGMAYRDVQRAVRQENWKLIRYPQINRTQLFDLSADPFELNDLAAEPEQAVRVEELTKNLRAWQASVGDDLPLSSESPRDPTFTPTQEASAQ